MSFEADTFLTTAEVQEAAAFIRSRSQQQPTVGLILGSGLGPLAGEIEAAETIPYDLIPHFPRSGAPSHAGNLVIGHLAGRTVLAMQGRTHFYEGVSMPQLTLPVRVMRLLGVETLLVTNAAGGINRDFQKGELMVITDHLNILGMNGQQPLRGPNLAEFGPRFPSMTRTYAPELIRLAQQVAARLGVKLREGVYAQWAGPTFETAAELRFLQLVGADAVGMSTVPEVIVAHHAGMRVLGLSSITNLVVLDSRSTQAPSEAEVWETVEVIVPKMTALVKGIMAELS